ncbi:MAG: chromosome segregation protein SMC [Actinomycetaceae bacterium]|nr:chromosome segregation protein SMC [Actinomycetaceae bacterium]
MHLKTLTLRGFKSFAGATTLNFEPGINCVVGPNGSGKSNVVDALAWVMGEQGAKTLRGGQMADVIFAGTATRPALGRAEVSLTIDNTDGALPIDYSEVTISRTLFRAGGSEYAINGTACRLLDIQELLSDSGMGREMHVIIGQGRLDEVLSASPEDRRGFIEEAAGVLKHRRRKDKALRKLESMQGNLTRIEDLTGELRRQLGPLARQAATARRAQIIQRDVFDARARLLADDLAQAQARVSAQTIDEEKYAAQRAALAEKILAARQDVDRLQADADAASPQIAALTEQWQRLSSLVERFRALSQLASERQRSLEATGPNIYRGDSPEAIRERAATARAEEEALTKDVRTAEDALRTAIATREKSESQENELDREVNGLTRDLADRRENAARISGQIATASSRVEALKAERERVQSAVRDAQQRAGQATAQVATLEQDVVAHTDGDDTVSTAHEEAARGLEEVKARVETARARVTQTQATAVQWQTKAETLKLSLAAQDATAWVVEEHRVGILGLVRDQIRLAHGWEGALEAALVGVAEGAIVESVDAAIDALRAAREADAGHLQMLIVSATDNDDSRARTALAATKLDGEQARLATDVVNGDDEVAQTLRALVQGTVLAADLVTARELIHAGAPRVATLAGDVLCAHQAWGGQVQQHAILARKATYDDAVRQAAAAHAEHVCATEELTRAQLALGQAQEEYDASAAQLSARDSQLAAVTAQLGVLRQSLASAQQEVARNKERITRIDVELETRVADLEHLQKKQADLDAEPEDLAQRVAELNTQRAHVHEQTVDLRSRETEARLTLRTREERLRAISGRAEALENNASAVAARIAQEERAAVRRAEAARNAGRIGEQARRALLVSQEILERVVGERDDAESARARRDTDLSAARRYLDELIADQRTLEDLGHRHELALAELRLKYAQLAERAIDDTGMEAETLMDEYGPHQLIPHEEGKDYPFVRADQEKRLARAQRDLARLGKINPLALEEHAALEERQKYLTEQLADLRRSREDLLQIVRDIDQRVHDVMQSAFTDVAREFESTFARLFPGGQGKLVLTEPDSILTTGLDIEARPPGKRVKRLSLLSGGERSLTAIAFLVAIFKARPSPFYVMDEVEAALDDTNLSRLLDIFRELQENSQLLVITHQKRTMEIADALYGVAMRENGVTSVISQRIKDVVPAQ